MSSQSKNRNRFWLLKWKLAILKPLCAHELLYPYLSYFLPFPCHSVPLLLRKYECIWSKSEVFTTTAAIVGKIVLLCYQVTKNFKRILSNHLANLISYIWSKSKVSMTTEAKVSKIVFLGHQLTTYSKVLAQLFRYLFINLLYKSDYLPRFQISAF